MQPIKANELCKGLGTWKPDRMVATVETDSRNVKENSLFVCIAGEKTDGHRYAAQAMAQGAAGILAQHPVEGVNPEDTLLISDPLDAMIAMGANYRAQFQPLVVGVTGSVGKTTTKEFCYAVFSAFGNTVKTLGNQNNEIGMPNTLFRFDKDTQYAVIEMGMQGLGEIHKLTMAARPAGAIITMIGQSHLEQLGTRENILRAKMEICDGLPQGAPLVINADNDLLANAQVPAHVRRVTFAIHDSAADVRAEHIRKEKDGTAFVISDKEYGTFEVFIPAIGDHNVMDAISAFALATRLGLDPAQAAQALSRYETTGRRQKLVVHQGIRVLEDCYNANPDSMRAGLQALCDMEITGRRIAVLGDMFELGSACEQAHRELADVCVKAKIDLLIAMGEGMAWAVKRAEELGLKTRYCSTHAQAAQALREETKDGDGVLVKASHGMAFEQILERFYQMEKHTGV